MIRMEIDFGVSFFGLTGACNMGVNWQNTPVHPKVKVTWHVESALVEEREEMDQDILLEDDITGAESAPENPGEPSEDGTTFQNGETDGIMKPENSFEAVGEDEGIDVTEQNISNDVVEDADETENPMPDNGNLMAS